MGEARRRKLAGTYPAQTGNPLSRDELLGLAFEALASGCDPTISGMTVIPADGSAPVYVSANDAKGGGKPH